MIEENYYHYYAPKCYQYPGSPNKDHFAAWAAYYWESVL